MSLNSSILNPITFKNLDKGVLPNHENRLNADFNQAGYNIKPFNQMFNLNDVITVQFWSDSADVPVLSMYRDSLKLGEISGALVSTYSGDEGSRYFFNYEIEAENLGVFWFQIVGDETLRSEPICVKDLTDLINSGDIKKISYSNFDRGFSDLKHFFFDWSTIENDENTLFFYVYSVDFELMDKEETELLEGSQSFEIVSSVLFPGAVLKTGAIPIYMVRKLEAVSSLDFFAVNGIQYIKDGKVEPERWGRTTSFQASINLIQKNAIGINVDNTLNELDVMSTKKWIDNYEFKDRVTAFDFPIPAGYDLHTIIVEHAASSTGNPATITAGLSIGGTDYIIAESGLIDETGKRFSFALHDRAQGRIYISISGVGVVLNVYVQFLLHTQ
jgi:hypothetical protein